jgi:hypothetical protein
MKILAIFSFSKNGPSSRFFQELLINTSGGDNAIAKAFLQHRFGGQAGTDGDMSICAHLP